MCVCVDCVFFVFLNEIVRSELCCCSSLVVVFSLIRLDENFVFNSFFSSTLLLKRSVPLK